jgi:nucleoside-diphosphate-sugar epimerase
MKKILVTGGTTFVSKYVAEYFVNVGYEVFVLNRNSKPQVQGVKLIEGDRHNLGGVLKDTFFDVVADIILSFRPSFSIIPLLFNNLPVATLRRTMSL